MDPKLYIANLTSDTTDEQLAELFSQVGEVTDVALHYVKKTNEPRGTALLTMRHLDEAMEAIEAFNGADLNGNTIRVERAKTPQNQRRAFIRNIPLDKTPEDVAQLFVEISTVDFLQLMADPKDDHQTYAGFVCLEQAEDIDEAIERFDGYEYEGHVLSLRRSTLPFRSPVVQVSNLTPDAAKEQIIELFWQVAPVDSAVIRHIKGQDEDEEPAIVAYIDMNTPEAAAAAIQELQGDELDGQPIKLAHASLSKTHKRQFFFINFPEGLSSWDAFKLAVEGGGVVQQFQIIYDEITDEPTNSALVELHSEDAVLKAIDVLDGWEHEGHAMRAEPNFPKAYSNKLIFYNLPDDVTEQDVADLLADFTEVDEVFLGRDEEEEGVLAAVVLPNRLYVPEILEHFKEYELDGRPIRVEQLKRKKHVSPNTKKIADEISDQLGETDGGPRNRIREVVRIAGADFAQAHLQETLQIEAEGGMLTEDGSRRRTTGGVFFYIVKRDLPIEQKNRIFNFKTGMRRKKVKHLKEPVEKLRLPEDIDVDLDGIPQDVAAEFIKLKNEEQEAEAALEEMKATPGKQSGLFSATKELWNLKAQIKAIEDEYPQLVE